MYSRQGAVDVVCEGASARRERDQIPCRRVCASPELAISQGLGSGASWVLKYEYSYQINGQVNKTTVSRPELRWETTKVDAMFFIGPYLSNVGMMYVVLLAMLCFSLPLHLTRISMTFRPSRLSVCGPCQGQLFRRHSRMWLLY